ncbi:MAG: PIN domain-containing protein [Actinomycetota bacterium]|nr:PIN domain-containing protein [Actinomycetota bacterium]
MKAVFLDTSGIIAVLNIKDKHHSAALRFWNWLLEQSLTIYITDYIFDETYTALRNWFGHKLAIGFGDLVLKSNAVNLIHVDEELFSDAWVIAQKHSDKSYSFTDCVSFALMERVGIESAFTFDRHFAQYGFAVKP